MNAKSVRASIAGGKDCWVIENGVMKAVLTFENGSIRLTSLVNTLVNAEYVQPGDPGYLFYFRYDGTDVYSNDGFWTVKEATERSIDLYRRTWGRELLLTLARTQGHRMQIKVSIQMYDEDAGMRMQYWITNLEDDYKRISESDLTGWKLVKRACDIHYAENSLSWNQTRERLRGGKRNAVVVYDTGDGWVLTPESNYSTSLEPGAYQGTSEHPFLNIDLWPDGESVKVSTDSVAVQAVIRPKEELEYFAVNLEVFRGDVWDGRLAAAKHLRQRYKFRDPSRILSVNDWFFRDRRTESYYRNSLVPALVEMGFDKLLIDDLWNTPTRDDVEVEAGFTEDLPALAAWIREQGLGIGYWFALTGDEWGLGRDLADSAQIEFKRWQVEEVLIKRYSSSWQQIDLGELWLTDAPTEYSHPSDSVYRKWLGVRAFMNGISHDYPDFVMQTTCELENPIVTDQSIGLMHLADNGIAGLFWGGIRAYQSENKDYDHYHPIRNLFGYFGLFPSEGMLDFWNTQTWRGTVAQFYSFLAARHVSLYDDPCEFEASSRAVLKRFNEWRGNGRIRALLNEVALPVPCDGEEEGGILPWMFRSGDGSQALLIVLDERTAGLPGLRIPIRWLSDAEAYLVQDVTLGDDGGFQYGFIGLFEGAVLRSRGLEVDDRIRLAGVRAYWIQRRNAEPKQVIYADDRVQACEEEMRGGGLWISYESEAGGRMFVYDEANRAAIEINLGEGKGTLIV